MLTTAASVTPDRQHGDIVYIVRTGSGVRVIEYRKYRSAVTQYCAVTNAINVYAINAPHEVATVAKTSENSACALLVLGHNVFLRNWVAIGQKSRVIGESRGSIQNIRFYNVNTLTPTVAIWVQL